MGERALIGLENSAGDGIRSVYTHWDGDVDRAGPMLLEHYANRDKVAKLVDGGDMSTLGAFRSPEEGEDHVIYYHRDMDEDWEDVTPTASTDRDDLYQLADRRDAIAVYLFTVSDEWVWSRVTWDHGVRWEALTTNTILANSV